MANTPYFTKAEAEAKNQETFREIKQTTEAISAGEGGKLYDTLAAAQAVDPKPVNGTVFTVSESDSANAGYHSFQSGSAGGTRFERMFGVDTVIKNGFINTSSVFIPHAPSRTLIKKVIPLKEYIISSTSSVVTGKYYVFTSDAEGQDPVGSRIAVTSGETIVTAPSGANYLFVCYSVNNNGSIEDYDVINYYTIYDQIEINKEGLEDVKFSVGAKENIDITPPSLPGTYFRPDVLQKSSALRIFESYNSHSIPVQSGDMFIASAKLSSSSTALVVFYDALGNNVGYALIGDDSYHKDVKIVAPTGATEMIFGWNISHSATISKVVLNEYKKPDIRVLLIGSSFGMNTIGQFPVLAFNSGLDVVCANAYQGSLSIQQLADYCNSGNSFAGTYKKFYGGVWNRSVSKTILEMLQDEKWDVISLQRGAAEDMTWNAGQDSAFQTVLDFITQNCDYSPKIVFNSGFADSYSIETRSSQQADSVVILNTANEVKLNYGVDVIPVANVLQEVRNNDTLAGLGTYADKMLSCDSMHLDQGIGMYVTGCICFNFFLKHLGKSVLTCKYLPTAEDMMPFYYNQDEFTPIEEIHAKEIRKIVNKNMIGN